MADSKSSASAGISTGSLLFVAFVVLKLCHVIDWSWWWVAAPIWGSLALVAVILLVILAIGGIASAVNRN